MAFNDEKKDPNFIFQLERNIKAYMLYMILILSSIVILLALAIIFIAPLKEVKPYLVFFSDGETNFVRVEQAGMDMRADENLLKSILAGYVKKRETINRIDDSERYEEIRLQSKKNVWDTFANLVKTPNSIYTTKGLYRNIEIINVSIFNKNVATIDFIAKITNRDATENNFKKYRATMYFDFQPIEITYNSVPKNPTGFIVEQYSITDIIENNENSDKKGANTK
ncbi:type IV secretion system protein [Campylobacter lari]|uniref:type IV secretion system protein n=1 Tax=Campylobacter lari TaxID=201 RepID=UPI000874F3C5|nr:VirB8/TrbF family protein [Campylobacter lari]EAK0768197.1 virulence protein [Campylobacter lari]EDP6895631.1 virulence protein [Campylobacter lari]EJV5920777.1 virulence protein [Campylobacter lari]MCV3399074.1 VirB8/TrbF family protein [Campylobacter lari]MCV3414612.1 VirB8/TrbF family protein [Campylobacter lari]